MGNATASQVKKCSDFSERATWKHISRLQGLCAVEFCIDECLKQLRSQLTMSGSQSSRKINSMNRISSFVAPSKKMLHHLHIQDGISDAILRNANDTQEQERSTMYDRQQNKSSHSIADLCS